MTRPRPHRLLTLLAAAGALAVVVLAGVYWRNLAGWIRFYRLFEYAGVNEQGYPEYRHRQTGIVFVLLPGGTFFMGSSEDDVEREEARVLAEGGKSTRNFLEAEQPQHEVMLSPCLPFRTDDLHPFGRM